MQILRSTSAACIQPLSIRSSPANLGIESTFAAYTLLLGTKAISADYI